MRLRLRLTDFQLATAMRLREPTAETASQLVARAIEFDALRTPEPRWRAPRPARHRTSPRRHDGLLDTVLPAATGRALRLAAGQVLRVEQLDDGQCVDLTAFELAEPRRAFCAARTRAEHGIHPTIGATLFSAPPEIPLLTIIGDSAPGHDLSFPACTAFEYELLTGIPGHLGCHEIHTATQRRGGLDAHVPAPLNLWLPSAVTASGELRSWPAACRRGDHIDFRAETDVAVVLATCPDDLYGSSQYEPKPVRLIVSDTDGRRRRSTARARITRATRTPRSAIARNRIEIDLPGSAAAHLERRRDDGWLGQTLAEVAARASVPVH